MKKALNVFSALMLSALVMFSGVANAQATNDSESSTVPAPIIDSGDMFSPAEEAALTDVIIANHAKYDLFFVIETVPSLNGQKLETVTLARANELGVGEAAKNNGVLVFLSRDDRKVRFELGRGVTPKVSDAEMTRIIDTAVTPQFKAGNYTAGIESGMTAVGDKYIGATSNSSNEPDAYVQGTIVLFLVVVGVFILVAIFRYFFGESADKRRQANREYWELKDSIARLNKITEYMKVFKSSGPDELKKYKALSNNEARLDYLKTHHPDFAALLQKHFSKEMHPTNIVDRSFYDDTYGIPISFAAKSNTPSALRSYKLIGKGFENMSIDAANKIIRTEKEKAAKAREKELKKKERARKIWNSIPEPTQKALKKAKTQSDRLSLLAGQSATDFSAHYALISSMFLSSGSSSSGSSSSGYSSSSRSSSSSSSSSSSYSSGSYGGGGFDGGGGSGSW